MSGPFVPVPGEVFDLLKKETPMCFKIYAYMLHAFFVEEDFDVPGDWVLGRIRASHNEISKRLEIDRSWLDQSIWPIFKNLGLVRDNEGIVELPMLYKKAEQYIIPAEVNRQFNELRQEIHDLREMLKNLLADHNMPNNPENNLTDVTLTDVTLRVKPSTVEGLTLNSCRLNPQPVSLIGSRFKDLSLRAISDFYTGIGQKKISKRKRERGFKIYEKLIEDGFTPEQIQFAVEWTLKNAKEEVYDFSILEHTVGQAMASMEREQRKQREREQRENEAAEREQKEDEEQAERRRILEHKETLGPAERKQLRREAEEEIRKSGQFDNEFIDDFVIDIRENMILRRRLSEKDNVEN